MVGGEVYQVEEVGPRLRIFFLQEIDVPHIEIDFLLFVEFAWPAGGAIFVHFDGTFKVLLFVIVVGDFKDGRSCGDILWAFYQ